MSGDAEATSVLKHVHRYTGRHCKAHRYVEDLVTPSASLDGRGVRYVGLLDGPSRNIALESQRMTCAVFGTADAGGGTKSENSLRRVAVRAVGVRGCKDAGMSIGSSDRERLRLAFTLEAAETPPLLVAASATSVAHANDERPVASGTSACPSRSFTALRNDLLGWRFAPSDRSPNALFGRPESDSELYSSDPADSGERNAGVPCSLPSSLGCTNRASCAVAGGGEREEYMLMNELLLGRWGSVGLAVLSGTALSAAGSTGESGRKGSVGRRITCARPLRIGAGREATAPSGELRLPSLLPFRTEYSGLYGLLSI